MMRIQRKKNRAGSWEREEKANSGKKKKKTEHKHQELKNIYLR
jgi:hypothetical protein